MKVVILAGGLGTRLAEETEVRPKPMVEIGGRPILWHIMKHYARYGFTEFVRRARLQGRGHQALLPRLRDAERRRMTCRSPTGRSRAWTSRATTGPSTSSTPGSDTKTGGRVKRLRAVARATSTFMLTYGDGVANVDLDDAAARSTARTASSRRSPRSARRPASASWTFDGDAASRSSPRSRRSARAGSTAASSSSSPASSTTSTATRRASRPTRSSALAADGQLVAYRHEDFWQCMDTLRDVRYLRSMWESGNAPWVTW